MKTVLKLSALLLLTFVFFACKQATGDSPGGSDTSKPSTGIGRKVILNSDIGVSRIPIEGVGIDGKWSITNGAFDGTEDAVIKVKENEITYAEIAKGIQSSITIPNTSVSVVYAEVKTGNAIEGTDIVVVATYTAAPGYIFENNASTKKISIIFDIEFTVNNIVIADADIKDSDITPAVGLKTYGTWSISNNSSSLSLEHYIIVDGTNTEYGDILTALTNAIQVPNTTVSAKFVYPNLNQDAIAKTQGYVNVAVSFTANAGFEFADATTSKNLGVSFFQIAESPKADVHIDADKGQSLQTAINNAADGQTLAISGTFTENITFNQAKTLTLIGYGKDNINLQNNAAAIKGNKKSSVITVNNSNAHLIISDSILLTEGGGKGSAINILKGKASLKGGQLYKNGVSADQGNHENLGAVYIANDAAFEMSAGKIHANNANSGGGVYVSESATFTMSGGSIEANTAIYGGGVYLPGGSTATMSGGKIVGNRVNYPNPEAKSDILLGSILSAEGATFTLGGDVVIDEIHRNAASVFNKNGFSSKKSGGTDTEEFEIN